MGASENVSILYHNDSLYLESPVSGSLQGPPLTLQSAVAKLLSQNVTVGVGVESVWSARSTRLDLAWVIIALKLVEAMSQFDSTRLQSRQEVTLQKSKHLPLAPQISRNYLQEGLTLKHQNSSQRKVEACWTWRAVLSP
jgi:hypothetical protein